MVYMCLDAVDGIHARGTNTASALGQIFDHGIDSIAMASWIFNTYYILKISPIKPVFYSFSLM